MQIQSSYNKVLAYTNQREGEIKLGQVLPCQREAISFLDDLSGILNQLSTDYIILGISEDIGVRANYGLAGTAKSYDTFLRYFVNIQKNKLIEENRIFLLGEIYLDDLQNTSEDIDDVGSLRELCKQIDARVYPIIKEIVKHGKIPIIIGGGHNNSYGNIKGCSLALNRPIEVLNIDPHADFRAEEGRHSGNGFRYAYNQSYMNKYGVWGLHENYNNHTILDSFTNDKNLFYQSFDYILRTKNRDFKSFLSHFSDELGIELDLDSIKNMPSSAMSPIGFTEEEVLEFLLQVSSSKKVLYYHLAEGSPQMESSYRIGKFLTYAVTTILKNSFNKG
jgi:formiminoglutamase